MPRYFENALLLLTGRTRIPLPSLSNSSLSPLRTPSTRRISRGTVICPLLVIVACFCITPHFPYFITIALLAPDLYREAREAVSVYIRPIVAVWRHHSTGRVKNYTHRIGRSGRQRHRVLRRNHHAESDWKDVEICDPLQRRTLAWSLPPALSSLGVRFWTPFGSAPASS
jgi:hypothetical protein